MKSKVILLVFCFLLVSVCVFAQTDPGNACDDQDPLDNNCPLDSWVYMLVLAPIAATLTAVFIRSQAIKELDKNKRENLTQFNKSDTADKAAPANDHQHAA